MQAELGKKVADAKAKGFKPEEIHAQVEQLEALDKQSVEKRKALMGEVNAHLERNGYNPRALHINIGAGRMTDPAQLPKFDTLARTLANEHPELFQGHGTANEGEEETGDLPGRLFELVQEGFPKAKTKAQLYDDALAELERHKEEEHERRKREDPDYELPDQDFGFGANETADETPSTASEKITNLANQEGGFLDPIVNGTDAHKFGIGSNTFLRAAEWAQNQWEGDAKDGASRKQALAALQEARQETAALPGKLRKMAAAGVVPRQLDGEPVDLEAAAAFYETHALPSIDALAKAVAEDRTGPTAKESAPLADDELVDVQDESDRPAGTNLLGDPLDKGPNKLIPDNPNDRKPLESERDAPLRQLSMVKSAAKQGAAAGQEKWDQPQVDKNGATYMEHLPSGNRILSTAFGYEVRDRAGEKKLGGPFATAEQAAAFVEGQGGGSGGTRRRTK